MGCVSLFLDLYHDYYNLLHHFIKLRPGVMEKKQWEVILDRGAGIVTSQVAVSYMWRGSGEW